MGSVNNGIATVASDQKGAAAGRIVDGSDVDGVCDWHHCVSGGVVAAVADFDRA